jgi:hypothetical protein
MQVQMAMRGKHHAPITLPPGKSTPVPFVVEAGCASGTVWKDMEKRKLLPQPGFELRTVQSLGNLYTDNSVRASFKISRNTM